MNSFVSMKTLNEAEIYHLIERTDWFANNKSVDLSTGKKRFVSNLFYEPSTRTKLSFEIAEKRLGFEVLDFQVEQSSVVKGESVYDTAKTIQSIGVDAIVIRHPEKNIVQQLSESLSIPIINAGDGSGEHPTQSLLDLYTMYKEFNEFKGLNVLIVGDIVHSRVAHSNAYALKTLGANVFLSAKNKWQDNTLGFPYVNLDEGIKRADVVMLLRVQRERHASQEMNEEDSYLEKYGLTIARELQMKPNSIIMHPAPVIRGVEIADQLVECNRSRIFKQMEYGVYARMAVLDQLLNQHIYVKHEQMMKSSI